MSGGAPKASELLKHARWVQFNHRDLAPEDLPGRLVWICRCGRTDYYVGIHHEERSIYRHTRFVRGIGINKWEIADIG